MNKFKSFKEKIANRIFKNKTIEDVKVSCKEEIDSTVTQFDINDYINKISLSPINAQHHLDFSIAAFNEGIYYLAYSELKTAEFLGISNSVISEFKERFLSKIEEPLDIDHNQFYRYMTLKNELINRAGSDDFSVLDVGGGVGQLASFIPNAKYCLVEPSVNGLSGLELPFDDNVFDYVVSCHVLEHIPEEDRGEFLDQLLSKAKKGVILLNPFHLNELSIEDRLGAVIDITDADWAKEHLECGFPKVEELEEYAKSRGVDFDIKASGSIATTTAMVFVSYFATRLGESESLKKINRLYNESYSNVVDSENNPTAYLVYLNAK